MLYLPSKIQDILVVYAKSYIVILKTNNILDIMTVNLKRL